MKPKILSWNVRGLNERDKRLRVRNLLKEWKAHVICLEETILENLLRVVVSSLWCCQRVDWCYLGSRVCKDGVNVR
jgi:hypothetical protein